MTDREDVLLRSAPPANSAKPNRRAQSPLRVCGRGAAPQSPEPITAFPSEHLTPSFVNTDFIAPASNGTPSMFPTPGGSNGGCDLRLWDMISAGGRRRKNRRHIAPKPPVAERLGRNGLQPLNRICSPEGECEAAPQCRRSETGSKSSACPSTVSAFLRTKSISQYFPI